MKKEWKNVYKDIFQLAKQRVETFASVMPFRKFYDDKIKLGLRQMANALSSY